ncbi:MAG TPA: hypothetical protein VFT04_12740 [Gemmatimonadales bacterium]|nr:hypothetical protein [Gemmatimonadales bacterium]
MADFRKTLESEDGERRAVILCRPDGNFQIDFERWDGNEVTGIGGLSDPFWRFEGVEEVAGTLEEAEAIAAARLGALKGITNN